MATTFEPGVRVSGHLLSEEIGRGGFSRVFRAEPVNGGAAVAIKVAVRGELVSALRAEGAVLRRLQGPRFVQILEEHLDDDPPYFVLELCPGGDLRARLDAAPDRRLPVDEALRFIEAILEGMAFAHDEGVVHGDLKPDNVLLDAKGEPKIADLGLSRSVRKRLLEVDEPVSASLATEGDGKVRGTFDYLAPEVRSGAELSPASDVFALGVTFYELLVGRRPLGAFQLPSIALARDGVKVPAWLDRILERSLAADPGRRYPDASIMLEDLRAGENDPGLRAGGATRADEGAQAHLVRPVNDAFFFVQVFAAMGLPLALVSATIALTAAVPGHLEPVAGAMCVVVAFLAVDITVRLATRKLP